MEAFLPYNWIFLASRRGESGADSFGQARGKWEWEEKDEGGGRTQVPFGGFVRSRKREERDPLSDFILLFLIFSTLSSGLLLFISREKLVRTIYLLLLIFFFGIGR